MYVGKVCMYADINCLTCMTPMICPEEFLIAMHRIVL
jgi:hypothetical protein